MKIPTPFCGFFATLWKTLTFVAVPESVKETWSRAVVMDIGTLWDWTCDRRHVYCSTDLQSISTLGAMLLFMSKRLEDEYSGPQKSWPLPRCICYESRGHDICDPLYSVPWKAREIARRRETKTLTVPIPKRTQFCIKGCFINVSFVLLVKVSVCYHMQVQLTPKQ